MPLAKHTKLNGLMQASTLNSRSLCGLQSLVSVPSAPPRPNLVQVICTLLPSWLSKSEPALELDPPVAAGAIAAATSDEGGRFAEIGRAQIPVRQGKVGVVQQISGQGGESQLHRIALPLRLFAQLESLGQAEVQRYQAGADTVIPRNDRLAGRWCEVEGAKGSPDDGRAAKVRRDGGPIRENGVAVQVATDRDVERTGRGCDKQGAKPQAPTEGERAAELDAMANIESGAAILRTEIVRIGGKRSGPIGVAVRFSERVRAVERDLGIDSRGQAGHELILLKDAARLIKVDGSDAGCRDAPDRSNGTRAQAVPASRMEVVDR